MRLHLSKPARARVFARVRVASRVCDAFIRLVQVTTLYLKYYFKWRVTPSRTCEIVARARNLFPVLAESFGFARRVGVLALVWKHLRVLYGFMRCKESCISSLVCTKYLLKTYVNCPVSWRKPGGVAVVRTPNPCLMVRKDTN